jgi:hypothetical protein
MSRGQVRINGRPALWYPLRDAANVLGISPEALRKQFERRARQAPDGGVEAEVDGVRARKFANRWRVSFGEAWLP